MPVLLMVAQGSGKPWDRAHKLCAGAGCTVSCLFLSTAFWRVPGALPG